MIWSSTYIYLWRKNFKFYFSKKCFFQKSSIYTSFYSVFNADSKHSPFVTSKLHLHRKIRETHVRNSWKVQKYCNNFKFSHHRHTFNLKQSNIWNQHRISNRMICFSNKLAKKKFFYIPLGEGKIGAKFQKK